MNTTRIVIWDSTEPVTGVGDMVVRWNGYQEIGNGISIFRYIEENKVRLKQKYANWIQQIGEYKIEGITVNEHLAVEKGFSLWWMSLLVEKSIWKSPAIATAIKIFALEEIILKYKPAMIMLVTGDAKLLKVVSNMCSAMSINFESRKGLQSVARHAGLRTVYDRLPLVLKSLLNYSVYLFTHRVFRRIQKPAWHQGDKNVFFCSYFFNVDAGKAANGEFLSFYWQQLHKIIHQLGYTGNWIQLFVKSERVKTGGHALEIAERFNTDSRTQGAHAFHDSYISGAVIRKVLGQYFRFYFRSKKLGSVIEAFTPAGAGFSLWPILKQDWNESVAGAVAINNLLLYALFDKAMSDLPRQCKGFYLFENQAWERAFITAWRKHGHGTLFAVPHSTRSFWDLRFVRTTTAASFQLPEADFVAVNGNATRDVFLSEHYPADRLIECEALRFGYLMQYAERQQTGRKNPDDPVRILVLGDYLGKETVRILKQLERIAPQIPFPVSFAVKPHPNHVISAADHPGIDLTVITGQIGTILIDFDVAYASNTTSAAVDAYLAGLTLLVSLDDGQLNISPLMERPDVFFVRSDKEFLEAVHYARNAVPGTNKNEGFFFLDAAFPRWKQLIQTKCD